MIDFCMRVIMKILFLTIGAIWVDQGYPIIGLMLVMIFTDILAACKFNMSWN